MNRPSVFSGATPGRATVTHRVFYQVTKDGSGGWYFTDQRGALYGPFADQASAEHVHTELQAWYRSNGRTVHAS